MGDALQGQGALGFIPGVLQNILAGPGYQTQDAQSRIANMLTTGGLIAANQPAAAVGARAQFGQENAARLLRLASPEFRDLPSEQQEAIAAQEGIHLPRDKKGAIVLPPVEAKQEEEYLKSSAGVEEIKRAQANYEQALQYGTPAAAQTAKAAWLRATGHPVPPNLAAAEGAQLRASTEAQGLQAGDVEIGGPAGPKLKASARPEQFPAGAAPPTEAPMGPPPVGGAPAASNTMPVETQGPGNPNALKEHTGGPPDVFMIDRGDGKGLRPWRIIEGQDGALTYQEMSPKEVDESRKAYQAQLEREKTSYDKAIADQMTAHAAAASVKSSLDPLVDAAFPAATPADAGPAYWASQMYAFHAPWNSNNPQQQFSGAARQALAKLAASLKMRPGPRSLDALEASHYRPGDSAETVHARLGRLADLPDNELRTILLEHGFSEERAQALVGAPDTAPMAAHPIAQAPPSKPAASAAGVDPDVAAILRARRKRR